MKYIRNIKVEVFGDNSEDLEHRILSEAGIGESPMQLRRSDSATARVVHITVHEIARLILKAQEIQRGLIEDLQMNVAVARFNGLLRGTKVSDLEQVDGALASLETVLDVAVGEYKEERTSPRHETRCLVCSTDTYHNSPNSRP